MSSQHLQNPGRTGVLRQEAPDQREFDALLTAGKRCIEDAGLIGLSAEGRFTLLYKAAHTLALAALRWHGYRSDKRYLVFQCLAHTVALSDAECRLFDACHRKRNLAEYEGELDITGQLLEALAENTVRLESLVAALGAIKDT